MNERKVNGPRGFVQFTENEALEGQRVRSREMTSEAKFAKLPQLPAHEDQSAMVPAIRNLPES
jgi:hypothetical protein